MAAATLPSIDDVEARARTQIGYVESGGPSGHNGNIVHFWPDDGWSQYQGGSWCGAYETWLFLPWAGTQWIRFLECNAGERLFKAAGALFTDPAGIRKGDVVFHHFPGEAPGANHVDWASADAKPASRTVRTIGGNTSPDNKGSQSNGGGVYEKDRSWSTVHAYGRPTYAKGTMPPPVPAFKVVATRGFVAAPGQAGGWVTAGDGGVFTVGGGAFCGSLGGQQLAAPAAGMAATSPTGYLIALSNGDVRAFGDAHVLGSMLGQPLVQPVVGIAATSSGKGYWLLAADGGVFAFGDAPFFGSMTGQPLAAPVMAIRPTPSGKGYWLLARDGGVFAFGDAPGIGSMAGRVMNAPVVGLVPTKTGGGYALVGADGGVFNFGDAAWQPYVPLVAEYKHGDRLIVGADLTPAGGLEMVSDRLETYVV